MAPHKFSVGQKVGFRADFGKQDYLHGGCTVVKLLPSENRDWQYRVKSDRDSHERVVLESQLIAPSVGPASPLVAPAPLPVSGRPPRR